MQRVKLFVFLLFFLCTAAFYGHRFLVPPVSGQSGALTLSAPSGVSASDGNYATKIGVMWETVRGANRYRVFRNAVNDPASATDVGTTAANYFFDETPAAGQNYFYWVRAENGAAASNFSASDQGLRANGNVQTGFFPPLEPPVAPAGNEVTASKAYLGKALFWDEQLSSTRTVSCGTCHRPAAGGSDPRTSINNPRARNPGFDNVFNTEDDIFGSPGVPQNNLDGTYSNSDLYGFNEQVTGRKAPSYLNAGYATQGLFWDGRATDAFRDPLTNSILLPSRASLESQILGPPVNSAEMGHAGRNWTQVAERVAASKPLALAGKVPNGLRTWINGRSYAELFEEVFGTPEVTPARIAMAIGTHERTLFSDRTPLDKWAAEIEPLTPEEDFGRKIFVAVQCNTCHDGSLMTDHLFHNIGVRPDNEDIGRAAVTNDVNDKAKFKTPNLRNVELRGPFMRNGRFQTLEEVVEFYNRGGDFDAPNIDHGLIRPLGMTPEQKAALVAFMKRPLTDPRVRDELPPFDRPQLYTESNRVPVISGTGRTGSGGVEPKVTAIEPPLVGNPGFTVAVSNAFGGAQAVLVINSSDPGVGASIPATGSFARQLVNLQGTGGGNGFGSVSLPIPNNPALVGQTFYGRWYVPDAGAANGFSVSRVFSFTVFGEAAAVNKTHADFDGDGKTDVSVFRPADGTWYISKSSDSNATIVNFGLGTDKLTPADYDGDGRTDIAIFREGLWAIQNSSNNAVSIINWGQAGDVPAPGDYDGDGRADTAVFRPSNGTWYLMQTTAGFSALNFGVATDKAVPADYDGDGRTDVAVFRDGYWYQMLSASGFSAAAFGQAGDKPVMADYDGDGRTDVAVFRPASGAWYFLRSGDNSFGAAQFGSAADAPSPGDYDGDGRADFAVFRQTEGYWYILQSAGGAFRAQNWGMNQDKSVPAAIVP